MVEVTVDGVPCGLSAAAAWVGPHWHRELLRWLRPYLAALPRARQRHWAPAYVAGLLGPSARKSIEPMAALVADGDYDQLHHFVTTRAWDAAPLQQVLIRQATRQLGGPEACLIIDDTTLLKKGTHSVGVSQQYSGAAGKLTNCQTLVTLTLARGEVPLPVAMRLFLPACWADDPRRCARAGVPRAARVHQEKWQLALEELDRVCAAGARFGLVLADAGYGTCAAFRQALSARGLTWAVGIRTQLQLYPATVRLSWARAGGGRRQHPKPLTKPRLVPAMATHLVWHRLAWRTGTKGRLVADFAALRVRAGDGPANLAGWKTPGEPLWLIGERRADGREQFYLSNLPATATLRELAQAVKARWACEQAHQQLKEEVGLDHFEGRSWTGLQHHVLLTMLAFAFLQQWRLTAAAVTVPVVPRARGKNQLPARRPARTQPPRDSTRPARGHARATPR
jgi:SRSO17 transposase